MRSPLVKIFLLSVLCSASWAGYAAAERDFKDLAGDIKGVQVTPSIVRLEFEHEASQESRIQIMNGSSEAYRIQVEIRDVGNDRDDQGVMKRVFPAIGTTAYSAGAWIHLEEKEFELSPHSAKDLNFSVRTSENGKGSYAAVLLISFVPLQAPSKPVVQRFGVLVFIDRADTLKAGGECTEVQYIPGPEGMAKIRYGYHNVGNTDLLLEGFYSITDQNFALVGQGLLAPVRFFPGDRGFVDVAEVPNLPVGDYELLVTIHPDHPQGDQIIKRIKLFVS